MKRVFILLSLLSVFCFCHTLSAQRLARYVDPRIGSEGKGRVFVGPCAPFGMAKPGPDGESMPNAGWAPMPERIKGFSQTHVSGTGGGQKYGNILIQPLRHGQQPETKTVLMPDGSIFAVPTYYATRTAEEIQPGYYSCTYDNGIRTEITASGRCALYRITGADELYIDATSFLGMDTIPDKRETQQFVGSHIEMVNSREICGWTSVRGGWNNGDAYKVYFGLKTNRSFKVLECNERYARIRLADKQPCNIKVGISYVSAVKALSCTTHNDFDSQRKVLTKQWDKMLQRVPYQGNDREMRIFYTALYHTLLMPTNKSGEAPVRFRTPSQLSRLPLAAACGHSGPSDYWDDYYAIWDTYRTSFPLLMEYYPQEVASMVRSLLNIYETDGFLPDARSGDCNGRTQGGSNAEVVLADAMARGLKDIDYEKALEAMIHDAEVPPADHEKEGRGGLKEYNTLGYIPYGIPRAGTRTMEYAYDDWCIAQVAKALGKTDLYDKYMKRSGNWRNLWRKDYEWQGMRGFILPRSEKGEWLDSVVWGKSKAFQPKIAYKPDTKVAPWNIAWWDTFFYEALSAEYSLSVPHDVRGLIELCGGPSEFRKRLDTFFENGHYNVGNEPSFLTPFLYHYIGRPDLSSQRIASIVGEDFSDTPDGLPGNDDSGAMSAWLIWAMLGKYPALPGGNLAEQKTFDGQPLQGDRHYLIFEPVHFSDNIDAQKLQVGTAAPRSSQPLITTPTDEKYQAATIHTPSANADKIGTAKFTLNRQFRSWPVATEWQGDTLHLYCNGCLYLIPRAVVEHSHSFCWESPYRPGKRYVANGTFLFISKEAHQELLDTGSTIYDNQQWHVLSQTPTRLYIKADIDATEMTIALDRSIPWVVESKNSPLGIDWEIQ